MKACDAAVEVLRETGNPAVGYGDVGLLHMIAQRAGMRCRSRAWRTEKNVLNALDRTPGILVKRYFRTRYKTGRVFYLPECVDEDVDGQSPAPVQATPAGGARGDSQT